MFTLTLILLLVIVFESCAAFFLWVAARWLRLSGSGYVRALATVVALTCINLLLHLAFWSNEPSGAPARFMWWLLEMLAGLTITWLVIQRIFRTSLPKAILAWLSILFAAGVNLAFVFLLITPFVLEPFIMPTSSMAPTLLGAHQLGTCPHCGDSMVIPYDGSDPWNNPYLPQEKLSICESCLQTAMIGAKSPGVQGADRFFDNKLLFPRRWDLVVYRLPANPSVRSVKRLVGLPGEEIIIMEGAIWINGQKRIRRESSHNYESQRRPMATCESLGARRCIRRDLEWMSFLSWAISRRNLPIRVSGE